MEVLEAIYTRRSVRQYESTPVARKDILEIVKAGSWAPSGLNNQPWRFVIVYDPAVRSKLAQHTKYRKIVEDASACVMVFIDQDSMYNEIKDHQAIGACLQNMLLAAHGLGLGAVWLGEILNKAEEVNALLELPPNLNLMAVVAVGHPLKRNQRSQRKAMSFLLLKEI